MEYTDKEKQALTLLGRTDFKNMSKTDALSFVSMINEMRPDVAKEALAQFPEFAHLVQSSLGEYREMLGTVIASDDESLRQANELSAKELGSIDESKRQFYDLANKVQADLSRCLDKKELSAEEQQKILDREMDVLKMASEKDSEMRNQQRTVVHEVHQKDSEKRQFNWKLVGGISAALVFVVGVGASLLGGKTDIHFPKKS